MAVIAGGAWIAAFDDGGDTAPDGAASAVSARPAAPPVSARAAAEQIARRHGVRLVFGAGVRADRHAAAQALAAAGDPEAALRTLLAGYELLFHYAPSPDGPLLETVWVFADPADVQRALAAPHGAQPMPDAPDAAALRRTVEDGDSEALRIAALDAWLGDPQTPPDDADRVLVALADSPYPLLAEHARTLRAARAATEPPAGADEGEAPPR